MINWVIRAHWRTLHMYGGITSRGTYFHILIQRSLGIQGLKRVNYLEKYLLPSKGAADADIGSDDKKSTKKNRHDMAYFYHSRALSLVLYAFRGIRKSDTVSNARESKQVHICFSMTYHLCIQRDHSSCQGYQSLSPPSVLSCPPHIHVCGIPTRANTRTCRKKGSSGPQMVFPSSLWKNIKCPFNIHCYAVHILNMNIVYSWPNKSWVCRGNCSAQIISNMDCCSAWWGNTTWLQEMVV